MEDDENQLIFFREISPFTSLGATFMAHWDLESRRFPEPGRHRPSGGCYSELKKWEKRQGPPGLCTLEHIILHLKRSESSQYPPVN